MALTDSLKEFYGKMEDGYYSLLDSLQEKGIPVYKAVDAIEGANIPSFPVALIAFVLVIFGIISLFSGAFAGATLSVTVQDSGNNPIPGAIVSASDAAKTYDSQKTNADGIAVLKVPQNSQLTISVSKNGFEKNESDFLTAKS